MSTPIAIIGMGSLFPRARDLHEYWRTIRGGLDAITEVPSSHWSPAEYFDQDPAAPDHTYSRRGGFLSPFAFDPLTFGIPPTALEATDTSQLLGLAVAKAALEDAGYGEARDFNRDKVSVVLGVTGTLELVIPLGARLGHPIWRKALKDAGIPEEKAREIVERISAGYVPWQENSFPGLLGNVVAGRIANRLNLGGTNCVVDAACASSLSAAHLAILELSSGKSDMVITGGVDTFNDIFMFMCFSKTPALSPTGDARPFDEAADGTILGEGIGMLVLKRLADAERDGDRIYSVIRSMGTSSDGRSKSIYAPRSEGQAKALRDAYAGADCAPESIQLVEAHGTGTKAGDAAEIESLKQVYGATSENGAWCALGSVKSQIGHTKAAAGAAGLMKAALALHHKVLPPTIKVTKPNPKLGLEGSPFYLNTEARPWATRHGQPRRAAVSAFGFGGSNFHAVLEEYRSEKADVSWDGSTEIVALSAGSTPELRALLATWHGDGPLAPRAAASRRAFRATDARRLVFTVEAADGDLRTKLALANAALDRNSETSWELPEGLYYGVGPAVGKTAFLFPGQGSQYVAMGRDLLCAFPEAQRALEEADATPLPGGGSLSELVFPRATFDETGASKKLSALTATDVAQPALGAISLAYLRVLERFGVRADAAAGHSFGELVALCAAGKIETQTLNQLARLRGQLMAEAGRAGDEAGGMLAVKAPLADLEKLIADEQLDLVLANRNSPTQGVLSGKRAELARAAQLCRSRQLSAVDLPVSAAFHSPLVARAAAPFGREVSGIALTPGKIPVYSNTTGAAYPAASAEALALLGNQLALPVNFSGMIEKLHDEGVRCFIEVGPKSALTGLVCTILAAREHQALSLDSSAGRRNGICDLARVLGRLAALGHEVKLQEWEKARLAPVVETTKSETRMTVTLCGANYRSPQSLMAPGLVKSRGVVPAAPVVHAITPVAEPVVSQKLAATQESLKALQALHQQTAALHKQFLEGQDAAQRAYQRLFEAQAGVVVSALPSPAPLAIAVLAPPVVAATPARSADPQSLERVLIQVVAEKTGYPAETLQLDMDLESDLGIDSIKRVEILAGVRERHPAAPSIEPEHLGALRTLRQIVDFISDRAGAPPQALESHSLETVLIQVVAEKTGYPAETLQLDMDLESDLGIDSIKRVEILAGVRERHPAAPSIEPEHLGALRTLRQIVDFITKREVAAPAGFDSTNLERVLIAVVSEKTGYPAETLQLDMDLESDLGIDSIKRVEILAGVRERVPEAPSVEPEHLGTLRTLRQIVSFLCDRAGTASSEVKPAPTLAPVKSGIELDRRVLVSTPLPASIDSRITIAPDHEILVTDDGTALPHELVKLLTARDLSARVVTPTMNLDSRHAPIAGLILLAPTGLTAGPAWPVTSEQFLKDAFLLLKAAGADLRAAARKGGALLLTVSRLDGAFGLGAGLTAETDPVQGGLAGLGKTVALEWPEVRARALDLQPGWDVSAAARAIVRELCSEGPTEVGLTPEARFGLTTTEVKLQRVPIDLGADAVVVITGGARGVTAEAALALARATSATLVLVGRSPAPEKEPEWLRALENEAEIKKALAAEATKQGEKPNPKAIGAAYRKLAANREISATLARIAEHSRVHYRSVDLRDATALTTTLEEVRAEIGPIRGCVHGAGLLEDRLIEDKTAEQFAAVLDTKVAGLRALLEATASDDLRYLAFFSSISGRLGRRGQVDYAMANEVLNKTALREARRRAQCRVVAIGWGPWDGGMVGPGLSREFAKEGVPLIPLRDGAEAFVTELSAASTSPVEVLVGGPRAEIAAHAPVRVARAASVTRSPGLEVAFTRSVSVALNPYLKSHVLGGRPVLPLAMSMEWLAHAALHGNPGLRFHGFKDLRVLRGLAFDVDTVEVAGFAAGAHTVDGFEEVAVELRSGTGGNVTHSRAIALLTPELPAVSEAKTSSGLIDGSFGRSVKSAYDEVLFHGDHFRGIQEVLGISPHGITARVKPAPAPSTWTSAPLRSEWIADPLIVDAAFQLAILWCQHRLGAPSLPARVGSYRQFQPFPREEVMVSFFAREDSPLKVTGDIVFSVMGAPASLRNSGVIAMIDDYECTVDAKLTAAFRPRAVETTLSQ